MHLTKPPGFTSELWGGDIGNYMNENYLNVPFTASIETGGSLAFFPRALPFLPPSLPCSRRVKLTKTQLFKVLKPFHDDDQKLLEAVDHLVGQGLAAYGTHAALTLPGSLRSHSGPYRLPGQG